PHGTAENEWNADRSLVGRGVGADNTTRLPIQHQRRVHVDVAQNDAVLCHELCSEQHPAHLDRVGRARCAGDRAHERLIRVTHVRVDHVEVTFVDGHIDRLAYGTTGVV